MKLKFTFGSRVRINKPGDFYDGCYAEVETWTTRGKTITYKVKAESPYCSANVQWTDVLEEHLVYISCGPDRLGSNDWKDGIEASREL